MFSLLLKEMEKLIKLNGIDLFKCGTTARMWSFYAQMWNSSHVELIAYIKYIYHCFGTTLIRNNYFYFNLPQ